MKTPSIFKPWLTLGLATLLTLGGLGAARAATGHIAAYGLISWMSSDKYDATELFTVTTHQNLIYANYDTQYDLTGMHNWESATWITREVGQRRPASLLGTDPYTIPIEGRYIKLRNLTVDHTDLDAQNVLLQFFPVTGTGGSSLTLQDGSLAALNPPGFNSNEPFTLTASGDSTLSGWGKGRVSSQTSLNVLPGGHLTLFRIAFNHSTFATDSWYFNNDAANLATIDGGTLKLDQTYVTFGPPVAGTPGVMTFQNGATLELTGEAAQLHSGYFNFNNSTLNVGGETRLRARAELNLDTAAVTVGSAGDIHTDVLKAMGASTMNLPAESDARFKSVTTSLLLIEPNAILDLKGSGTLAVTGNLNFSLPGAGQSYGRIDVNDYATLLDSGGTFEIRPGDIININRTSNSVFGLMSVSNGGIIEYLGVAPPGTNHVTNEGQIAASNDGTFYVPGHATLLGSSQGILDIGDDGMLDIGTFVDPPLRARNSLTTDNEVYLGDFSRLTLTLDPTNQVNDKLNVGPTSGSGSVLYIDPFADLSLAVVNDAKLTAGAKFRLINYAKLTTSGPGLGFNGYPEGHIFSLGLNAYRINYADTADAGYAHAITLTVVDNPALSPAVQQVAGIAGSPLTPTSALTPLNFEPGCVLVYTAPSLPPNLGINANTGVISGTPLAAQTAANITITGTGKDACSSQSAQATVTLTVAATQTITFDPPLPTPTFTPNGTFIVSATATSALSVVYSSLTPAICSTNGGSTIRMLGAGTCTIAADQPGNAGYAPAPQVTQDITIGKGTQSPLVLSASPPSIAVTGGGTSLLQTTGGSGGGSVSYNKVSGPCNLVGATVTGTAPGNCVFKATQAADTNYTASTSNDVTVVVTATALKVVYSSTPLVIGKPGSLPPTVTGSTGTMTYSLLTGTLPPGLALDPVTGVISGTPKGPAGQFDVAIKATDGISTVVNSVTIVIQGSPAPNSIPTLGEWGAIIMTMVMLLIGGHRRLFGR